MACWQHAFDVVGVSSPPRPCKKLFNLSCNRGARNGCQNMSHSAPCSAKACPVPDFLPQQARSNPTSAFASCIAWTIAGGCDSQITCIAWTHPLPLTILRVKRPTIINRRECIKKTNPARLLRHEIPNSWVQPSLRSLLGDEDFLKASAVGVLWSCDVYKS